jgi:cyclophilin family peptidyl-prolyl cis-trans isomerase
LWWRLLHNQWIVFGGIGVIAFFTVFGTCLGANSGTTTNGDQTLDFNTATPQPSPTATATQDPNATGTPAPTATPIQRQYATAPSQQIDPAKRYVAIITTDKGTIRVELNPAAAPRAVNSFVFLANNHYYDGLTFQRVSDFFAQAGDAGQGLPGYTIAVEQSGLKHDPGSVSLARSNVDNSITAQFYIAKKALPNQDGKDTVIGKVIDGMEVVKQLPLVDPSQPNQPAPAIITSLTIDAQPQT